MASLQIVYRFRHLVLLWSVIESLITSAVIYGWASLVVVFKEEKYFHDLCDTAPKEGNSTTNINSGACVSQDERLNLVFTVGVFTFSSCGIVVGPIVDHFGPRKTRLLSCIMFGLSYLFFGLSDKGKPYLLFPGIMALSSAGLTRFITVIPVANMFERWKSSVISLFNGSVDSSSVILLFFKLVYDAGVPLKWIYMLYFIFSIITILAFTFVLPSYTITTERVEPIRNKTASATPHEGAESHSDNLLLHQKDLVENGEKETSEENKDSSQKQSDEQQAPLCEGESVDLAINNDPEIANATPSLLKIISSPEYLLLIMFLAVYTLRLWFYVGSLNSYLEYMSDGENSIVSRYTNWFGIIQFGGFLFAPFVGLVMDWKPKKKKQLKTDIGFVIGFTLTNITALSLNILVLIPNLTVQYASFVNLVVMRAFIFATYASFVFHKFPIVHYGKLYGIGQVSAAVFGCLQYLLFTLLETSLEKDPFWINVLFLVLCLVPMALPIFLWHKEAKKERTENTSL